jgi:uridine kinase
LSEKTREHASLGASLVSVDGHNSSGKTTVGNELADAR